MGSLLEKSTESRWPGFQSRGLPREVTDSAHTDWLVKREPCSAFPLWRRGEVETRRSVNHRWGLGPMERSVFSKWLLRQLLE